MDKHLNFFYSYNNDEELIENNLTRSFILTLMGISDVTRGKILSFLSDTFISYNFVHAEFALQNYIRLNPKNFKNKYIITVAADSIIQNMEQYLDIDKEIIKKTLLNQSPPDESKPILNSICGGAIPDAWIYDSTDWDYCFLIECKTQGDYLYYPQIMRHAYQHYGLYDPVEINNITIKLTWNDILEAIEQVDKFLNEQEHFIIENFIQFLRYYGFTVFRGFDYVSLTEPPDLNISTNNFFKLLSFEQLQNPIDFKLIDN